MKHEKTKVLTNGCGIRRGIAPALPPSLKRNGGMALFLAISLLALFSALGASYIRFTSLELGESNMRIRDMRVRQYATAGINSAAGNIQAALAAGQTPAASHLFSYAVYGDTQCGAKNKLKAFSTYTAEAKVSLEVLEQDTWNDLFPKGPVWPGERHVFRATSAAAIQRAVPGRIQTIANHAVEAILIARNNDMEILYWNAARTEARQH